MDLISRQEAIKAILGEPPEVNYPIYYAEKIRELPISQAEPCDFCIHKDDCGDMKMYCPAMGYETDVKNKTMDIEKK